MPSNTTISLPPKTWTQITTADVIALRVQNQSGYDIRLMATAGAVAPASSAGSIMLRPYEALAADLSLSYLWPGVAGANRVYAICETGAEVSVSHA